MLELEIGQQLTIPSSQLRGSNNMSLSDYTRLWEIITEVDEATAIAMVKATSILGDEDSLLEKILYGESFDWRACTAFVVQQYSNSYFAVCKDPTGTRYLLVRKFQ